MAEEADHLADRIAVLYHGRIVAQLRTGWESARRGDASSRGSLNSFGSIGDTGHAVSAGNVRAGLVQVDHRVERQSLGAVQACVLHIQLALRLKETPR
jgi:ABC-type glutathione transport system ATPase component